MNLQSCLLDCINNMFEMESQRKEVQIRGDNIDTYVFLMGSTKITLSSSLWRFPGLTQILYNLVFLCGGGNSCSYKVPSSSSYQLPRNSVYKENPFHTLPMLIISTLHDNLLKCFRFEVSL